MLNIHVMNDIESIVNNNIRNIYKIHNLPLKKYGSYNCGYVMQDGTCVSCEPYQHVNMLGDLIYYGELNDVYNEFSKTCLSKSLMSYGNLSNFDAFALIYLGWIKITAYADSSSYNKTTNNSKLWSYDWSYITVRNLTEAQTNIIFKL